MKASEVGWQPLSAIRFRLRPSMPFGNCRLTARLRGEGFLSAGG
jgi:hypothetical protein